MTAAFELIRTVEANGGELRVEDGWLVISPEDAAGPVIEKLREHKAEIICLLQSRGIPPHDPVEWREPFARWMNAACVRHPRCFGGMVCLHQAFCEWAIANDDIPCTLDTFELLLEGSGFLTGQIAKVVLVSGLILREHLEGVNL